MWCQGFSEPNAGSDLASLRCTRRARRRRLRASTARRSGPASATSPTYCEMLVRTDPDVPKHKGITLADRADGHARHRHPPARDHGGHRRVLRGVLRRRARPGRQPRRRRERRLARHQGHAELRARHRVRVRRARVAGARARPRRAREDDHQQRRDHAGRTPACGASSARIAAELDALWALTKRNISQAQRTGLGRRRRQRVQARVHRPAPAPRRRRHAPARPRVAARSTTSATCRTGASRARAASRRCR